jgi:hypothetical protein
MTEQAMVDHIAKTAGPRLMELLKLKIRHVYETTPGRADSQLVVDGSEIRFRLHTATQPYKDIERFMTEEKLIGFLVNPGVLSIVKAISMEVRGRKMLVTRKIQPADSEAGVSADVDDFGARVRMVFDAELEEARVIWECLYGVA